MFVSVEVVVVESENGRGRKHREGGLEDAG